MSADSSLTASLSSSKKGKLRLMPWIVCGVAAIFYCYEYLLRVEPSVMMPQLMQAHPHLNGFLLGSLIAYYYHAYTPMQLPVGMLMDRFGPRRLLTIASLICALGTYIFATSNLVSFTAIGRLLVGFGSAFAFVGVLKLARAWLPANRFAMMSGITSALGIIGALTGDILLTSLVEKVGWRSAVILSAIVGIVLAVIIYVVVRDRDPLKANNDHHHIASTKEVFQQFVNMMKKPSIWFIGLIGCLLYLPTSSFAELWGILYFQQAWQFTPHEAAYAVSTIFVGWGVAAPISGLISDRLQNRRIPMLIGAILGSLLIAIIIYAPHIPKSLMFPLLFIFGATYSVQVIVFAYACDVTPVKASGTVLAMTNMLVMLGGSLFQPIIGHLLEMHGEGIIVNGIRIYSLGDYHFALSVLPLSLLLGGIITFLIKEPIKHRVTH